LALKYDGDARLFKVGCRYYDPQLGAFTSRDTQLDQKPYLYCEHDPVNAVDPSGHDGEAAGFGLLGALTAVPGLGEVILVGVGVVATVTVVMVAADRLDEWWQARQRQRDHKTDGRVDRQNEKGRKDRIKNKDPEDPEDKGPLKKDPMKHKQGDARNY